jgi:regulation of enolase protein 1 (concanavalin A-like superfamily)
MIVDESFPLASIPSALTWRNPPEERVRDGRGQRAWKHAPSASTSSAGENLSISAGSETDWFIDPAGGSAKDNAPIASFVPPDPAFCLQARVTVDFAATYDAGTLFIFARDALWAKLCFEYSPQQRPMIVSVVTRGLSDDCNSAEISDRSVYLRLYRDHKAWAFHYSLEGRYWHLVRYFSLGEEGPVQVGFSAQSPLGQGCQAIFSEIQYRPGRLSDLRNGE